MADGRVLSASGGLVSLKNSTAQAATITPQTAVTRLNALGLTPTAAPTLLAMENDSEERVGVLNAPGYSLDPVPVKLQYVATPSGVELAWKVIARPPGPGGHWYEMNVDATSGAVLSAGDWVRYDSYNVYGRPTETPDDGPRAIVTNPADPVYSPFGWHDTNGVAGAEFTDTRGNNVNAQEDIDANNSGGFRPDGGASLNFDFPLDLTQAPSTYQAASVTNLFYWNNILHDVFGRYGFTEAAGNFQTTNYSGAGLGNDAVNADAQDGTGTNNANFAPTPDGTAPRMQMYRFTYTSLNRDGDLDNQIIAHEYGHGVSSRLAGGPSDSNSLSATQSGGMGEGWSDWWGLMFTLKPTDGKLDRYPVGTYVKGENRVTGAGIRRYPYSFDKTIDPLTLAAYNSSQQVHNVGEIWCSALYDMAWLLIDKYGFGDNFTNGYDPLVPGKNGGNNLAMQLVTNGLKLLTSNPSFLQARDGILQADQVLTGGANKFQIWSAFARRGMGFGASDGGSASSSSVTEAFDLPLALLNPSVASHVPVAASTTPIASVDFNFTESMDPASFSIADDVVSFTGPGGVDLKSTISGFAWLNSNSTLRINFAPLATNGRHTLVIGPQILAADGGAMDQNTNGTSGETADRYTATLSYDALQLAVVSTTPATGATVNTPFTAIEIKFNEEFDPATVGASDLVLSQGTVTGTTLVDATTVRYTLSGVNAEGTLNFSLAAGALSDKDGFPMLAYSGNLNVDIGTRALPAATPVAPAGSQIHQTSGGGVLGVASDTDDFTILLDAGQTLTVLIRPTEAGLRPTVTIKGPGGTSLGTATASAAGRAVILQTAPAIASGAYTITVGSTDATTGAYTVAVTLNSAIEVEEHVGPTNDTQATAQELSTGVALPGGGTMTSVAGRLPETTGMVVTSDGFESGSLGPAWATYSSNTFGRIQVTGAPSTATGAFALIMDRADSNDYTLNEAIWTVNLAGLSAPSLLFSANSWGDEMTALPTSFSGHVNGDGVAISANGADWYTVWTSQTPTTWTAFTVNLATAAAAAGIALGADFKIKFQQYDHFPVTTDGRGWDNISITHPAPAQDYFSVPMGVAQRVTIAAARTGGTGTPIVSLYNAAGDLLAGGVATPTNVQSVIDDFSVPATGLYYIKVSGTSADYSLVITQDAAFDLEPNANTTPQNLNGRSVVVGAVRGGVVGSPPPTGPGAVYTGAKDITGTPLSLGFAADGSFIGPTIGARLDTTEFLRFGTYVGGFTVAFNGSTYTNGGARGTTAFPVTLEDLSSGTLHGIRATGMVNAVMRFVRTVWWRDGDPFAMVSTTLTNTGTGTLATVSLLDNHDPDFSSTSNSQNDVIVDATGQYVVGSNAGAHAMALGSLDARAIVSVEDPIDVTNPLDVLNSPLDPNGASADDSINIAFNIGTLGAGQSTTTQYAMVFGATPAAARTTYSSVATLTQGGPIVDEDNYRLTLGAGEAITFRTRTPGDGPDQFENNLDPILELYDPSGNLVMSDDNGAGDGRNALLNAVATVAGNYTLRVKAAGTTTGEYYLDGQPALTPDGSPGRPDLFYATDSGLLGTDNITNFNNSTPAKALSFIVPGTVPGATVNLYHNGNLVSSAVAVGYSTFLTLDGSTVLADGDHVFTARQTPAGGTQSPVSAELTVTIRTTTPAAPTTAPQLQAASDSGISNTDRHTNVRTPTFDITAGPYFRVYRDGTLISSGYESGATYTTPALNNGVHAFTVTAVDLAGNESAASPASEALTINFVTLSAPTSAPDLRAAEDTGISTSDNITSVVAPTLDLFTPAGRYFRLFKGATQIGGDYNIGAEFTLPTQTDNASNWTVVFLDAAGNQSAPSSILALTIDATAPATPAAPDLQPASDTGGSNTDNLTSDITPTFDVASAPYFRFYRDGTLLSASYATGAAYTTPTLATGTYLFTVQSVDAAGNVSPVSPPLSVTINTAIPAAPSLYVGSDSGFSTTDRITSFNNSSPEKALAFIVNNTAAGATISIFANGVLVGSAISPGGTMAVVTDGSTVIPDGPVSITARQTLPGSPDGLDSDPLAITIDTAAPAAPAVPDLSSSDDTGFSNADNITTDTTPTFNIAGTSLYRLFVNGGQVSSDFQSGTFFLPQRTDGVYTITVQSVDEAGNVSPMSAPLILTIDTIIPLLPGKAPDLDAASDTGVSNTDNITKTRTPMFHVPGVPAGMYFRFFRAGSQLGGNYETGPTYTAPTLNSGGAAYTFALVDAAGNVSLQGPPLNVTIDFTAPSVVTPDLQAASDSGISSTDNVTNVTQPTMTVQATEAGFLHLEYDVQITPMLNPATTISATAAGQYSITMNPRTIGFATPAPYSAAASTQAHRLLDVNSDGVLDLVVADTGLSIFRGIGNGQFAAANSIDPGAFIHSLAFADFDGDNKIDIAAGVSFANVIRIFRGDGSGAFTSALDLPIPGVRASLGVADMNGDGKKDLIAATPTPNGVCVWLGNGDMTFASRIDTALGSEGLVDSILVAELSGDAKQDVVVTARAGGHYVLRGKGDGAFETPSRIPAAADVRSLTGGDFNGDGRTDLLFDTTTGAGILLNNGDATFRTSPAAFGTTGVDAVLAADFNGDGKLDVAVNTFGTNTVMVNLGNGDGTFRDARFFAATALVDELTGGDLNGDGIADIVASNLSGSIAVLLGTRINHFTDGVHVFNLRAEDIAGNVSGLSTNLSVTFDTAAPAGPAVAPDLQPTSDTGVSNIDNITRNSNLVFNLGTPAGTYSRVYRNGTLISGLISGGTYSVAQAEGTSTYRHEYVDAAGNSSPLGAGIAVTVDQTVPAVTVNTFMTADNTPTLRGTVDDPSSRIDVRVNNFNYLANNHGNGNWELPNTVQLAPGTYDVSVTAIDLAGNTGVDTTVDELIITVAAPKISVMSANLTPTQRTVLWVPVTAANQYFVEYDTDPGFASPDGNSGWLGTTGNTHTFTGLTPGATYSYRVKARIAGQWQQTTGADFATGGTPTNTVIQGQGDVVLARTTTYAANGNFVAPVNPIALVKWGRLIFNKTTPAGTTITVDVLNAADTVIATNVPSGADLDALGITASTIKLRANFATSDPDATPVLHDWMVLWEQTPEVMKVGPWSSPATALQPALVSARHLFYNNSAFDTSSDDAAIATDKAALLPGQIATLANYTSYNKGINGVMIDVIGLAAAPTIDDFDFRVGTGNDPSTWTLAPAPLAITRRAATGVGEPDRVIITFPDGAIRNTWLQVTLKSTAATNLGKLDVFYFGNVVGESGNGGASPVAAVDPSDETQVHDNFTATVGITSLYDFNRDGVVDALDETIARDNHTGLTPLKLLWAPITGGPGTPIVIGGDEVTSPVTPPAPTPVKPAKPVSKPAPSKAPARKPAAKAFAATPIAQLRPAPVKPASPFAAARIAPRLVLSGAKDVLGKQNR